MKYHYTDFKKLVPELSWTTGELADKLSAIGFETETARDNELDVTLTSNRKDCQDLSYLAFDLAGVYGLKTINSLITFSHASEISVTPVDINKLLGSNIGYSELKMLERLGFLTDQTTVTPPDFRDIKTVADVAEEVVRVIGFDKLTVKPLSKQPAVKSVEFNHLQAVKTALSAAGLSETATTSFSSHGHVKLKNPFADDEPFLRESLQDGLLRTLGRNPFLKRAAFYEIGSVFTPNEEVVLGVIIAGYKKPEELQQKIEAAVGQPIGFTQITEEKAQKFDAKQGRISWGQLPLNELKPAKTATPEGFTAPLPKFQPISKFPPLVRDITLTKDQGNLVAAFHQAMPQLLLAELVDEYQGNQTYRLIFQKMDSSFSEADIRLVDDNTQKYFFSALTGVK